MKDSFSDRAHRAQRVSAPVLFARRVGLVLAATVLLGMGLLSAWRLAGAPFLDAWRSRAWPQVTAKIDDVAFDHSLTRGATLQLAYRYRFQGRLFRGERYGVHGWMDNADSLRQAYADLLFRRHLPVRVNPERPSESLANRDIHWSVVVMSLPALAAAALGGALLWAALSAMRDSFRLRRKTPMRSSDASFAGRDTIHTKASWFRTSPPP